MSTTANGYHDPEDMFAHTRMSLGDHIEELRRYMIRALLGFLVAMVIGFFISKPVLNFINAPVEKVLVEMHEKRRQEKLEEYEKKLDTVAAGERYKDFKILVPANLLRDEAVPKLVSPLDGYVEVPSKIPLVDTLKIEVPKELSDREPKLTSLTAPEVFLVYMKVSVYCGIVLSSPWIFYQMWMFVAAGMYPHEKKYIHIYLPFSLFLFLCGVAVCEFWVLPLGINYLLGFNEWMGIQPELRLSDWLSFAIMMPLISGAAFQTPLIMFFMERVGIVTVEQYIKHWRIAIFSLTLAGALLAASPDPLSMMSLAVPMCALYGLGILMCKWMPKREELDLEVPESEEMIEA